VTIGGDIYAPWGVDVNPNTNKAYVSSYGSNEIYVIDGDTVGVKKVIRMSSGNDGTGVGVNPETNRTYVATNWCCGANIAVIDGATDTIVAFPEIQSGTGNGLAVNPKTNRVYLIHNDGNLTVMDGTTYERLYVHIGLPRHTGWYYDVAVDPERNLIYATYNGGWVYVVDGSTNRVVTTIPLPGKVPGGIAVDPSTRRIYVANSDPGSVLVIDGATNTVVEEVPLPGKPEDIAVNRANHHAYATVNLLPAEPNAPPSAVSIIDGTTNTLISTVRIGYWNNGAAANATNDRAYVIDRGNNKVYLIQE
jgi:YVTN family beta-propeller protein